MKKTICTIIILCLLISLTACSETPQPPASSPTTVVPTTTTTVPEKVIEFYPGTELPQYDCIMDAERYPSNLYYYGPYETVEESRAALIVYGSIISTEYGFSVENYDNKNFWIYPPGSNKGYGEGYLVNCDWVIDGKHYVIFYLNGKL